MSPLSARSVSIALVGAIAAVLLFSQGLLVWAGLVAWAAFLDAGGDAPALKRTIAGTVFGACMGWIALTVTLMIPVPAEGWFWLPRAGAVIAVTLFVMSMATRVEMFSRFSMSLLGYATIFGAEASEIAGVSALGRLEAFHLYNPLPLTVISMAAGATFGLIANKLTAALTSK